MNVGQTPLDAVVVKRQPLVVETEEMQHGGVEVVPAHRVDSGAVADLIALAVGGARLEPGTGHPDGEPGVVVIAPLAHLVSGGLGEGGTAKLGGESDERIIEHAAAAQVLEQRGHGLVDTLRLAGMVTDHVLMAIPAGTRLAAKRTARVELNEANAALEQPARQDAVARETPRLLALEAVFVGNLPRLLRDVADAGNRDLHAGGEFVVPQPRAEIGIAAAKALQLSLLYIGEQTSLIPGRIGRDRPRREKIADRVLPVAEGDALVFTRQEPVAPA